MLSDIYSKLEQSIGPLGAIFIGVLLVAVVTLWRHNNHIQEIRAKEHKEFADKLAKILETIPAEIQGLINTNVTQIRELILLMKE